MPPGPTTDPERPGLPEHERRAASPAKQTRPPDNRHRALLHPPAGHARRERPHPHTHPPPRPAPPRTRMPPPAARVHDLPTNRKPTPASTLADVSLRVSPDPDRARAAAPRRRFAGGSGGIRPSTPPTAYAATVAVHPFTANPFADRKNAVSDPQTRTPARRPRRPRQAPRRRRNHPPLEHDGARSTSGRQRHPDQGRRLPVCYNAFPLFGDHTRNRTPHAAPEPTPRPCPDQTTPTTLQGESGCSLPSD